MLPEAASDPEIKAFIQRNKYSNLGELLLKRPGDKSWDWLWIGQQLEGYQKAKQKIPSIAAHEEIIYPKRLSLQQCSSDLTAKYKAKLFQGRNCLDLSGGFGIDTIHFSKNFDKTVFVEQDKDLCDIISYNIKVLGLEDQIKIENKKAEEYLGQSEENFDLIYIDPARRDAAGKKVYRFSDCSPDIIMLLDTMRKKSKTIFIKAAPMLDISQGVRELRFVEKVYVLAGARECKELLFVLGDQENNNPEIISVQLDSQKEFSFYPDDEVLLDSQFSMKGKYLYNPGPAIIKAGGYKSLAKKFNLNTVHPNTHLFLSDEINRSFPGRMYKVREILTYGKKYDFEDKSYTIYLKNFPFEKNEIMKKYKIREGTDFALFAFSSTEGKNVLTLCEFLED